MIPLTLESILEGILDDEMTGSVNPPQVWLLTLFSGLLCLDILILPKPYHFQRNRSEVLFEGNFLKVFRLLSLRKHPDLAWPRSYVVKYLGKCVSGQTFNSGSHCAVTSTGNYNNNVEFDVECRRVRTSFCADEMTNTIWPLQAFHCKVQQKTLEVISWIRMPNFLYWGILWEPHEEIWSLLLVAKWPT